MRSCLNIIVFLGLLLMNIPLAHSETVVTTYITKTQEERKSTRWTLTEWLHIKERMKMMDLWLAMFSNSDKSNFRPELNLSYSKTLGSISVAVDGGEAISADVEGSQAHGQLWLTNLISASTGLRTLNIDLGVEGHLHRSGEFSPSVEADSDAGQELRSDSTSALNLSYMTGNLRIFGGNVQDTSLVLKYGKYELENSLLTWDAGQDATKANGVTAGVELVLYLFGGLGAEGHYQKFGNSNGMEGDESQKGSYYDYQGFLEISLLRFTFGLFNESWTTSTTPGDEANPSTTMDATHEGYLAGLKLLF